MKPSGFTEFGTKYILIALLLWTAAIWGSFGYGAAHHLKEIKALAVTEARTNFNLNYSLRLWASGHGGVYVPATEKTPPNPYLSHVPERDIKTPAGKRLTLMNPAYMMRQVMQEHMEQYGTMGQLKGARPLNPQNAPDDWEKTALDALTNNGASEFYEISKIGGIEYLRYMGPMTTQKSCLKCHTAHGFVEGKAGGGISIAVPMERYYAIFKSDIAYSAASHGIIWSIGIAGLYMAGRNINKSIKERNLALKELEAERDRAQNYLDIVGAMVIIINADQTVGLINKKGCAVLGRREDEIIGKNWFDNFLPERLRKDVRGYFFDLVAGRVDVAESHENEVLTSSGDERLIEWHNIALKNERGRTYALLSAGNDITERKMMEERLLESERRQKEAEQIGMLGHWEMDIVNNKLYWSDQIYRIFELNPNEFGASYEAFLDSIHPDDREFVNKSYTDSLKNKTAYDIVHRLMMKDGTVKFVNERCKTHYDENGNPVRSIGTVQDITERKEAEDKTREALARNERLLRELQHRVKNNMQVILSLLKLQQKDIKDPDASEKFKEALNRISSIAYVHDLLYKSIGLADVDMRAYVVAVERNLCAAYGVDTNKIAIRTDIPDVRMEIESAMPCGLIINELLTNSIMHAFDGGEGEILVSLHKSAGDEYELSVSDNGSGIPADIDPRHPATFGLMLVNSILEQLRGRLEADTTHGTRFTMRFNKPFYPKRI